MALKRLHRPTLIVSLCLHFLVVPAVVQVWWLTINTVYSVNNSKLRMSDVRKVVALPFFSRVLIWQTIKGGRCQTSANPFSSLLSDLFNQTKMTSGWEILVDWQLLVHNLGSLEVGLGCFVKDQSWGRLAPIMALSALDGEEPNMSQPARCRRLFGRRTSLKSWHETSHDSDFCDIC